MNVRRAMARMPLPGIGTRHRHAGALDRHGRADRDRPSPRGFATHTGQITMRKVDGWKTLADVPSDQTIDLAA